MKASEEIRSELKKNNLKQWELCQIMGISESTLIRWLRSPLSEKKKQEIISIIHQNKKDGDR